LLTDLQLKPGRSENFEAVGRHNLVEIELATSRRTSVTRSMSPRSHLALKLQILLRAIFPVRLPE
jgi:hypothetical protein